MKNLMHVFSISNETVTITLNNKLNKKQIFFIEDFFYDHNLKNPTLIFIPKLSDYEIKSLIYTRFSSKDGKIFIFDP